MWYNFLLINIYYIVKDKKLLMINITNNAKDKITHLLNEENTPKGKFLRVSVKAGGCSGLSYDLSFDDELKDTDKKFEDKGVLIVTDVRSLLYLMDMTLDFSDGINGKGFQFNNPNATRTCGCGESFAL
jgi:iron-sulfur cluster assembly protein